MKLYPIYPKNDNLLTVALQDEADDSYINDAVLTVTVVDSAGVEVSGLTWPVSFSYVAGSNGVYRATLDKALLVTVYGRYTAQITGTAPGGLDGYWELPLVGTPRDS